MCAMHDCSRSSEIRVVELSLNSLMSEFSSKVSRADSPARRGTVHPLTSQILVRMVSEVPLAPSRPWTHSISMPVIVYKQSSHLWKLKEHFCTEQRRKTMNVIFYILFSVGQCWNLFFVLDMHL